MVKRWLTERAVEFLTRPLARYERCGWNDLAALRRHIRRGDVLLSQGDQRVSAIIRYLTQSVWTHATLYLGDEVLAQGGPLAERARAEFGDEAGELMLDAVPEGVVLAPLSKYVEYNLRLCRPHQLRPEDLGGILGAGIANVGKTYDLAHLMDLARYYLPAEVSPRRLRREGPRLGSGAGVVCSSLIAELFDGIGYPVSPIVAERPNPSPPRRFARWRGWTRDVGRLRRRHPSFVAPCDFDRSPYFEIVKFNVLADGDFDYRSIHWEAEGESARPGPDRRSAA